MDLVDVAKIAKENRGIKFLLTVIDVFSKFAYVEPIKNKKSETILVSMKKLFKIKKPKKIQSDKGSEFKNKLVQKFLKEKNVKFYTTNSSLKASVIERFNRTIKEKMWRYFTFKNNFKYIDILNQLVDSYNNSYHRSIKTKPSAVNISNEKKIWKILYGFEKNIGEEVIVEPKFFVGDRVRISKDKGIFSKGYTPNWTIEIFVIEKILLQNPPLYIIKDLNNEEIEGKFYEQELQKIETNEENYKIEKIIRKRKRNNQVEYFVKWLGYPMTFNSWIKSTDIIKK